MKRSSLQKGSAVHIVVVGVLVVALCAALGVIFYQNFIVKKGTTSEQTAQTNTPATETTKTAQLAFNSDIYGFDYPATWTPVIKKAVNSTDVSTVTFTNKDQTVHVVATVSGTQTITPCDANDGLKISDYTVGSSAVTKLTGAPLFLVAAITDKNGGGYTYKIGLTQDGGATHGAVGQSRCIVVPTVGNASNVVINSETGVITKPAITTTIDFPKLSKQPDGSVSEMQPIKDMLTSHEYTLAIKILESARKE